MAPLFDQESLDDDVLGPLTWAALCFSSLHLQVGRVLLGYLKSKPLLLSSLSDRVNLDAALAYQAGAYIFVLVNLLTSLGVPVPYQLALVLCHSSDFFGTLFFLCLTARVVVRYAQVKLKAIDVLGDEEKAHRIIRLSFGLLALVVVGGRCHLGAYSSLLPPLIKEQDMDIKLHISLAVMSSIVLTSLLLNVILRILIWVEKHRDDHGRASSPLDWNNLSGNKYVLISLMALIPVVANVAVILHGTDDGLVRNFKTAFLCIAVPCFVNTTNGKIRVYVFKSMVELWPKAAGLQKLRKSGVSPLV